MYGIGYRFTVILGAILAGLGFGLSLLVKEYYQAIIASVGIGRFNRFFVVIVTF